MNAGRPRDRAFPGLHIRPDRGWLNDPNGLSLVDGVYHVFFQYNPDSARHGAICWGHVSSTDLLTWRAEPVALVPRPGRPDSFGCWTGVVTLDAGVPTAVYCAVLDAGGPSQVVLAHSDRVMRDWVQEDEPVVGMPADARVAHVRDPFVFTVDGHRWAIQGAGLADEAGAVLSYLCDDLHSWAYRGVVIDSRHPVAAEHAPARIWECPQFVRFGDVWVLVLSPIVDHGPEPLGPVAWLAGRLVAGADTMSFVPSTGGVLDTGPAFYAPQVLALADRVLMWGWSPEHGRSLEDSDAAGWAGVLTFPRELRLVDGELTGEPASELDGLRGPPLRQGPAPAGRTVIPADAFEVEVRAGHTTEVRLDLGPAGPGSADLVHDMALAAGSAARLFVDGSLVEVFVAGEPAHTLRAYPRPGQEWSIEVSEPVELTVWPLRLPRAKPTDGSVTTG